MRRILGAIASVVLAAIPLVGCDGGPADTTELEGPDTTLDDTCVTDAEQFAADVSPALQGDC